MTSLTDLQELSLPLADLMNPETIRLQAAEIARLQHNQRHPEFERAVIRFVEERREDICTEWSGKAGTLHTLAEQDTSAFAEVVDRMLSGNLTGLSLLCPVCVRPECGLTEESCQPDVLSTEERFRVQMPEQLFEAYNALFAARGMEND